MNSSANKTPEFVLEPWVPLVAFISVIILLTLSLVGIFGNLLSVAIFAQPQFRRLSINLLLMGLSVADLFLLVCAIPTFATAPLLTIAPPEWMRTLGPIYTVSSVYVYPLAAMAQCTSIWLLVAVTIERWAAVCRPFLVATYFTCKRALMIIGLVILFAIGYNAVRFWEFTLGKNFAFEKLLRNNADYMLWKVTIGNLTTTYLMPLSILVVLNSRVAQEIFRSQNIRTEMTAAQRGDRRSARMLLFVVLMFLFCYTMSLILNLWELLEPSRFDSELGHALSDLTNILTVLNSATSWLFYLKFSTRYRQMAAYLLGRLLCLSDYQKIAATSTVGLHSFISTKRLSAPPCALKQKISASQSCGHLLQVGLDQRHRPRSLSDLNKPNLPTNLEKRSIYASNPQLTDRSRCNTYSTGNSSRSELSISSASDMTPPTNYKFVTNFVNRKTKPLPKITIGFADEVESML